MWIILSFRNPNEKCGGAVSDFLWKNDLNFESELQFLSETDIVFQSLIVDGKNEFDEYCNLVFGKIIFSEFRN